MKGYRVKINVNGHDYEITVDARETLLDVLRERLGLTGTKRGCEKGDCGVCSVILDGKLVNSCLVLAVQADGAEVLTIEGLSESRESDYIQDMTPGRIQKAFMEAGAIQCGYCTPGMIMAVKALLDSNPRPSEAEILRGISGNLCRCTGYVQIADAVKALTDDRSCSTHRVDDQRGE